MPQQQPKPMFDLSGGLQTATSRLIAKPNEVFATKNADYNIKIGSAVRRPGYEQVGDVIEAGNDGLGLHVYKYYDNNKMLVGINNSADTFATVRYLNSDGSYANIITDAPANTRFNFLNSLDEVYVAGKTDNNTYITLQNIDYTLTPSSTRSVLNAPKCAYIAEFQGKLYALNVEINGKFYKDRAYISSAPLGAVTYVNQDQKGLLQQLKVDSVRYLKAGMIIDIYGAGSETKKIDSLTIRSVNKSTNIITFGATSIDLKDNDEIWLEDRKGTLTRFWNTDYPTEQSSDWVRIPPGLEPNPEITGYGFSNNRMFFFTENSTWKFDGSNLINVSDYIGCASHNTIKTISNWMIWLHKTGVWGWNDSTGQLRLLSRSIQNYIRAINQNAIKKASAVVNGRIYKLAVGELLPLDSDTTSTSTSSTSTSSTSSSTSSTSTSSTSTSSTSSSTSVSSTSTSSTSISTSSTSISTSSTSVSTSSTSTSTSTTSTSTSTSTTTVISTKQVVRFIYDFDMNAWWTEYHKREFRAQIMHTMHGYTKPYFLDETGRLFRDETTTKDFQDTIPFEVQTYPDGLGSRFNKRFNGCTVESEQAAGTQVSISIDGGDWKNVGQVHKDVETINFPGDLPIGKEIAYKFTHNDGGVAPSIDGIETYFSNQELRIR